MAADNKFHSEYFTYLLKQAPVLFFILSEKGIIVESSGYAIKKTGHELIGKDFRDIVVDFAGEFDLNSSTSATYQEILLTISITSGLPQSYYFTFKRIDDHIMAFGRMDIEDIDKLNKKVLLLNQDLNNLTRQLHKKNAQLQDALDHVKTLQGIVPICMHCHKIRNDRQIWDKLEAYLTEHTEAKLSHSICPECAAKYYPDMDLYGDEKTKG